MSNNEVAKLPTLQELHHDAAKAFKHDQLNLLLNQPVPAKWIKKNRFVKVEVPDGQGGTMKVESEYLPIDKVKFLLTRIFQTWKSEIISYSPLFNAVAVHLRLSVRNPIDGEWIVHDGVGAVDVQTKSGASAADLSQINAAAVQRALPAAASYALKNAAEKLGGLFGANLQKYDIQQFSGAYTPKETQWTKPEANGTE